MFKSCAGSDIYMTTFETGIVVTTVPGSDPTELTLVQCLSMSLEPQKPNRKKTNDFVGAKAVDRVQSKHFLSETAINIALCNVDAHLSLNTFENTIRCVNEA